MFTRFEVSKCSWFLCTKTNATSIDSGGVDYVNLHEKYRSRIDELDVRDKKDESCDSSFLLAILCVVCDG